MSIDLHNIPQTTGVYFFKDRNNIPIYIGKAINIRKRIKQHLEDTANSKEQAIILRTDHIEWQETSSEFEALVLEAHLVWKLQPHFNSELKDDKSPLYIHITKEAFPKIRLLRKNELEAKPGFIFGPLDSRWQAYLLLRTIRKSIPFCSEKKPGKKECFYAHLGLCNPCPNSITTSNQLKRYQKNIRRIKNILQGKGSMVIRDLKKEMRALSVQEKFEEAAILRNKIAGLERLFSGRLVLDDRITDASFMENIRAKELQELETVLQISPIHRIECFDISNFQFKNAVASMVVSVDGVPVNGEYRRFKIKGRKIFDPEMLLEVLSRRMKHAEWQAPELLVLDGGTPQLFMVYPKLKKLYPNLPHMIGIAKRPDRIIRADTLAELPLKKDSLALHIIERLRDEAHRFAKKYHTLLRKNEVQYTL